MFYTLDSTSARNFIKLIQNDCKLEHVKAWSDCDKDAISKIIDFVDGGGKTGYFFWFDKPSFCSPTGLINEIRMSDSVGIGNQWAAKKSKISLKKEEKSWWNFDIAKAFRSLGKSLGLIVRSSDLYNRIKEFNMVIIEEPDDDLL